MSEAADKSPQTEIVQAVVPISVGDEIRADAKAEDRSVSKVISRILVRHYGPRLLEQGVYVDGN